MSESGSHPAVGVLVRSGGRAKQRDAESSTLRVVAVLAVVEDAQAEVRLRHVHPHVCGDLEARRLKRVVLVAGSIDVAVGDVVRGVA